eukprot:CAMPEP_0170632856 /NCGR_PEP_ID=MMETSP0224-20130122/35594_1 /TAXON_ID=285029 /ORGANISM="Togula jolla, Strain CCCM 725" /LENGTH=64 /DNA_ID=CAMNT_0010961683 /DNA_START=1 /DNA_END=194 /DNA_ORIENTATION=-
MPDLAASASMPPGGVDPEVSRVLIGCGSWKEFFIDSEGMVVSAKVACRVSTMAASSAYEVDGED